MTNIEYTHSFKTGRIYDFEQVIEYKEVKTENIDLFNDNDPDFVFWDKTYHCRDKSRNITFEVTIFLITEDCVREIEASILDKYDKGEYKNI